MAYQEQQSESEKVVVSNLLFLDPPDAYQYKFHDEKFLWVTKRPLFSAIGNSTNDQNFKQV